MAAKRNRAGAVRKNAKKPAAGSGGRGRKALEGRGPTPRAEDRPGHPKARAKVQGRTAGHRRAAPVHKESRGQQLIFGRNAVLEALRARIPVTKLVVAERVDMDQRLRDVLDLAAHRGLPVVRLPRADLDRMTGPEAVHQGIALQIPPYRYAQLDELLAKADAAGAPPLLVALDGVTDPRNLGAIIRSVAAFGGHGVIIPERRSAGVSAAAWKTSAGAALRVPVAMVPNLAQALRELHQAGLFVVGLDGDGDTSLPTLGLASEPLVLVVGSEGRGLSRLIAQNCDVTVSIPIESSTESLNAGIAAAVSLYAIATARSVASGQAQEASASGE